MEEEARHRAEEVAQMGHAVEEAEKATRDSAKVKAYDEMQAATLAHKEACRIAEVEAEAHATAARAAADAYAAHDFAVAEKAKHAAEIAALRPVGEQGVAVAGEGSGAEAEAPAVVKEQEERPGGEAQGGSSTEAEVAGGVASAAISDAAPATLDAQQTTPANGRMAAGAEPTVVAAAATTAADPFSAPPAAAALGATAAAAPAPAAALSATVSASVPQQGTAEEGAEGGSTAPSSAVERGPADLGRKETLRTKPLSAKEKAVADKARKAEEEAEHQARLNEWVAADIAKKEEEEKRRKMAAEKVCTHFTAHCSLLAALPHTAHCSCSLPCLYYPLPCTPLLTVHCSLLTASTAPHLRCLPRRRRPLLPKGRRSSRGLRQQRR